MTAATFCPLGRPVPPPSSTTPTHSIPSTRGKRTLGEWPWRVYISERFRPNALTLISTQPGFGSGTGISLICNTSGPPGYSTTAAFICVPLLLLIHKISTSSAPRRRESPSGRDAGGGQDGLPDLRPLARARV